MPVARGQSSNSGNEGTEALLTSTDSAEDSASCQEQQQQEQQNRPEVPEVSVPEDTDRIQSQVGGMSWRRAAFCCCRRLWSKVPCCGGGDGAAGTSRGAQFLAAALADFTRRHLAFALIPVLCLLAIDYGGLAAFGAIVVTLLIGLLSLESYLVYCCNEPPESRLFVDHPSRYGLPSQTVLLEPSPGVRLHCYLLKQPDSASCPTLLFLHGNAGNVGHRLPNCALLYQRCRANVFLLEYRGYGLSSGAPSEAGLYADAAAALRHLSRRADVDPQRIVLFGRSLGGAVAVELASRPETAAMASGLVLENTFTSLPEAASCLFRIPYLSRLPALVMTNRFNSRQKMPSVRLPTLVLSGLADTLVPPAMPAALHGLCASGVRRLQTFADGEHNTTWQCRGYFEHLAAFLHFSGELAPIRDDNFWATAGAEGSDDEGCAGGAASASAAAAASASADTGPGLPTVTVL